MKRFVVALALACILSGTALAGNIPTGGIAPPPGETQTSPIVVTIILTIISLAK